MAPSLTLMFKKSLHSAIVPDKWKLANVVPVLGSKNTFKTTDKRSSMIISMVSCRASPALHNLSVLWTRLETSVTEESKLISDILSTDLVVFFFGRMIYVMLFIILSDSIMSKHSCQYLKGIKSVCRNRSL